MEKKILVVEDDRKIFDMIVSSLDSSSFEVIRARAVDEALGAVEEEGPFDCIVVDLSILANGLTLEQMEKYRHLEGYAFLKEYLWTGTLENYKWNEEEKETKVEKLRSKTIICSRYIKLLEETFGDEVGDLKIVLKDKGFEKEVTSLIKNIFNHG